MTLRDTQGQFAPASDEDQAAVEAGAVAGCDCMADAPDDRELELRAAAAAVDELQGQVTALQGQLRDALLEARDAEGKLEAERSAHAAADRRHCDDIEVISSGLIDEASSRGWCEDYDTFVDGLNGRLNKPLRRRSINYDVEVEVTFTVTLHRTAADEDGARGEVDSGDVASAVREFLGNEFCSDNWDFGDVSESD